MSLNVQWHDEQKTIIHMLLEGEYTVEEWFQGSQMVNELVKSTRSNVYVIREYILPDGYLPSGLIKALPDVAQFPMSMHDNVIRIFEVGHKGIHKTTAQIYVRTFGTTKAVFVDTLQEALETIASEQLK